MDMMTEAKRLRRTLTEEAVGSKHIWLLIRTRLGFFGFGLSAAPKHDGQRTVGLYGEKPNSLSMRTVAFEVTFTI